MKFRNDIHAKHESHHTPSNVHRKEIEERIGLLNRRLFELSDVPEKMKLALVVEMKIGIQNVITGLF